MANIRLRYARRIHSHLRNEHTIEIPFDDSVIINWMSLRVSFVWEWGRRCARIDRALRLHFISCAGEAQIRSGAHDS